MSVDSIRAFSNPKYDYYRLKHDFGLLKAGTIFYHDTDDTVYGSVLYGCLKNCWTPDGNCENGLCGGTVVLHAKFINTDWFEKVERTPAVLMESLAQGYYRMEVHADGSWTLTKYGCDPD